MSRSKVEPPRLSRYELQVLAELWRHGELSVREVQQALEPSRRPAYTTVQTILARLEEKGAVRRSRKVGNAFLFSAVVTRRSASRRLVDELVAFFGGTQPLIAHLVESGRLGLEDLRALEAALADAKDSSPRRERSPEADDPTAENDDE